jgi:hypothetical protein
MFTKFYYPGFHVTALHQQGYQGCCASLLTVKMHAGFVNVLRALRLDFVQFVGSTQLQRRNLQRRLDLTRLVHVDTARLAICES